MEPGTITVRGTGTAPGRPDDLRVALTVTALEASPGGALDDVTRRSQRLQAVLDDAGVPTADRSTSAIAVGEVREWEGSRQVSRGYRAAVRVTVRLAEAAALAPLLARAMTEVAPEIGGPTWRLGPDNPARLQACRLAVSDARQRAEACAGSLGSGLGAVVAVAEAATGHGGEGWATFAAAGLESAGAAGLPVEPGEVEVTAAVDVTFRLDA